MSGKGDAQIAKRLVRHARVSFGHYLLRSQGLCFEVLACKDQFAYLGDVLQSIGVGVVIGPTCPDSLLVQLNLLHTRSAKYHGSQPSVAQR